MAPGIPEGTIIRRAGAWLSAQAGEELMMMSAKEGLYLGLNRMGARIWDLLEGGCDYTVLQARLVELFEVDPERCREEVDAFLDELKVHGAITLDSSAASEPQR